MWRVARGAVGRGRRGPTTRQQTPPHTARRRPLVESQPHPATAAPYLRHQPRALEDWLDTIQRNYRRHHTTPTDPTPTPTPGSDLMRPTLPAPRTTQSLITGTRGVRYLMIDTRRFERSAMTCDPLRRTTLTQRTIKHKSGLRLPSHDHLLFTTVPWPRVNRWRPNFSAHSVTARRKPNHHFRVSEYRLA
jgi:hypothetical protein